MPFARTRTGSTNPPRQPRRRRRDPRSRPVNGAYEWGMIKNPDPTKKYVAVNMNDSQQGPEYYEYLGYEPVIRETGDDALQWFGGKTVDEGAEMTNRGHMLMAIDKEKYEDLVEWGANGTTGQARADEVEDQILDRRGGVDELRGMHRMGAETGFTFENQIEASHDVPLSTLEEEYREQEGL